MPKLSIAYVASEVAPFSKTGGLADVAGALPQRLAELKNEVVVFSPRYPSIDLRKLTLENDKDVSDIVIWLAGKEFRFNLYLLKAQSKLLRYYFIDCPPIFDREGYYIDPATGEDYPDNDIRFAFFARAVMRSLERLAFRPDILHVNDWQSALIPAYLKTAERDHPFFQKTKTVLTIHNVAYQGIFPASRFDLLGINKSFFFPTSPFEYWGKINFLKAGIVYSDLVNTVSEKYAEEIQTSNEYGYGLEGVLKEKRSSLYGIINGVDYDTWSPSIDRHIKRRYDEQEINEKYANKAELLRLSGLPAERADKPLIGIISRLTDQKGFDLIAEIADRLFERDVTLVLLGAGDEKYQKLFEELQAKYPDRIKVNFMFDEKLAHLIEAGADIFLMPSRFEPCGLNQMYSLKYGTVPVARKTGGLADTIIDFNGEKKKATGFLFEEYSGEALLSAIERALELYKNKRSWKALMRRGMKKDFSWKRSARKYTELYRRALEK